ncbi:MAG: hypothetical protein Q9170_000658 [Blastenia crenularia]
MPTPDSFARSLGYTDSGQYTRGDAQVLYEAIDTFLRDDPNSDPIHLTKRFLENNASGLQFFGRTGLSIAQRWPSWDHDRESIMINVYHMFRIAWSRLKGYDTTNLGYNQNGIAQVKLELGCYQPSTIQMALVADIKRGGIEPHQGAVVKTSIAAMIHELQEWMNDNPGQDFPSSSPFDRAAIRERFAKETIVLTEPDKIAWIFRMTIPRRGDTHLTFVNTVSVLRLSDGTCMLVRPSSSQTRWTTHSVWKGGIKFSDYPVAVSCGLMLSTPEFLSKINVWLSKVFGDDSIIIRAMIGIGNGNNSQNPLESLLEHIQTRALGPALLSTTNMTTSLHLTSTSVDESASANQAQDGRTPTSLNDEPVTASRSHTPAEDSQTDQKLRLGPFSTTSVKTGYDRAVRDTAPSSKRPMDTQTKREHSSSSPENISKRPRTAPSVRMDNLSTEAKSNASPSLEQTDTETSRSSHDPQSEVIQLSSGFGHNPPSRLSQEPLYSGDKLGRENSRSTTVNTQKVSSTNADAPSPSIVPAKKSQTPPLPRSVRFHFFPTNERMGALSKWLEDCSSAHEFFDCAKSVLRLERPKSEPLAFNMTFPGKAYPTLVMWQDEHGYSDMMEEIRAKVETSDGRLDIEIRIMREGL